MFSVLLKSLPIKSSSINVLRFPNPFGKDVRPQNPRLNLLSLVSFPNTDKMFSVLLKQLTFKLSPINSLNS